nr:MAG TPA: hypothetical protein [Caudoviricetes sp.]
MVTYKNVHGQRHRCGAVFFMPSLGAYRLIVQRFAPDWRKRRKERQ